MRRKLWAALAAGLFILPLAGCGGTSLFANRRRLEDLDLVRTICVDKAEDGVNVLVCASTTGESPKIRMFQRRAASLAQALGQMETTVIGHRTDLSHTEHFVIGEAQAREGIGDCLDYVLRYGDIRLDTNLFIVRGGEGRALMEGVAGEEASPAAILMSLTEKLPHQGEGYVFSCKDAAVAMAGNGCALAMALEAVEEERLFEGQGELRAAPAGLALLVDGRLTGYLTAEETLGAVLLLNKLKALETDLTVDGRRITAAVDGVKARLRPRFRDGDVTGFQVELTARANVVNTDSGVRLEDSRVRRAAEEQLAERLQNAARAALDRSLAENVDFLDLGGVAWRAEPRRFRRERFKAQFSSLRNTVTCEATLSHTYDVTDALEENGEEGPGWWERLRRSLSGS